MIEVTLVLFGIIAALPFAMLAAHGRERTVHHIHTIRHEYAAEAPKVIEDRKLLKG